MWFLIVLLIILVILACLSIKIVRQSEVYIIERLGKFHKIADAGLTIIIPFIDHVRSIVSLKQQTMDVPPQDVITKDNVTIRIDTVVFYRILEPAKAVYEIQSLKKGIEYLSITTIRDIVGKMDLDSTFTSRDAINDKLRAILDEATDRWGCKIDRVEIQNITPPPEGMEKEGYHVGYKYPHDYPNHYVEQQYLPDKMLGTKYFIPDENVDTSNFQKKD